MMDVLSGAWPWVMFIAAAIAYGCRGPGWQSVLDSLSMFAIQMRFWVVLVVVVTSQFIMNPRRADVMSETGGLNYDWQLPLDAWHRSAWGWWGAWGPSPLLWFVLGALLPFSRAGIWLWILGLTLGIVRFQTVSTNEIGEDPAGWLWWENAEMVLACALTWAIACGASSVMKRGAFYFLSLGVFSTSMRMASDWLDEANWSVPVLGNDWLFSNLMLLMVPIAFVVGRRKSPLDALTSRHFWGRYGSAFCWWAGWAWLGNGLALVMSRGWEAVPLPLQHAGDMIGIFSNWVALIGLCTFVGLREEVTAVTMARGGR